MTTCHVFFYKWPRIKEGLVHQEVDLGPYAVEAEKLPAGSYIYSQGKWFTVFHLDMKNTYRIAPRQVGEQLACQVPKEIRTLALILNL